MPATESEGRRLGEIIAATQGEPDDDSRRLTRALLESGVRDAKTAAERTNAERLSRFSQAMCRSLLGETTADQMGVSQTSWRYVVPLARRLVSSMELVRENLPFAGVQALSAGTRYWDRVVELGLVGAITELALPHHLSRAA